VGGDGSEHGVLLGESVRGLVSLFYTAYDEDRLEGCMNSETVLQNLLEGNRRFAGGRTTGPHRDAERRHELIAGQNPEAIVITCSDSRVVPELLFDAGIGDLFVIRVAGNVATPGVLASLEFAADELGCPLCVVLGHTSCGAVQAAASGEFVPGHIDAVTGPIAPAVEASPGTDAEAITGAVIENVRRQVAQLGESEPILRPLVERGSLAIRGAIYDIAEGTVEMID
jgi:carbonic anhydrase